MSKETRKLQNHQNLPKTSSFFFYFFKICTNSVRRHHQSQWGGYSHIGQSPDAIILPNAEKENGPKPTENRPAHGCMHDWAHGGHGGHQNVQTGFNTEIQCWTQLTRTETHTSLQTCTKFDDFGWISSVSCKIGPLGLPNTSGWWNYVCTTS